MERCNQNRTILARSRLSLWRPECRTGPVTFTQPLDEYIESFHGRAGFSSERMSPGDVMAFPNEIRALVAPFCTERVELQLVTEIVWGKRLAATQDALLQ